MRKIILLMVVMSLLCALPGCETTNPKPDVRPDPESGLVPINLVKKDEKTAQASISSGDGKTKIVNIPIEFKAGVTWALNKYTYYASPKMADNIAEGKFTVVIGADNSISFTPINAAPATAPTTKPDNK